MKNKKLTPKGRWVFGVLIGSVVQSCGFAFLAYFRAYTDKENFSIHDVYGAGLFALALFPMIILWAIIKWIKTELFEDI